jgi:4-amino-4-deoxy-L-arabinose transferase-like glycosyltransferase
LKTGHISTNQVLLAILLLAGIFLETWNIGKSPVEEWDEARRGINAIGMINHDDYLTYYYLNEADDFVNKPPLATWLISINFRIFGYNAFALRLHSVVAIIFFFIYSIRLIRLYKDLRFTLLVFSILITVKGVIGFHVGRTGDTDSLLLLFITAAVYHFLRYWDFGDTKSIYLSLFFAGLGFYSKGLAILLIAPGLLGIIALSLQKEKIFNRHVALSLLLFAAIVASWYLLAVSAPEKPGLAGPAAGNLWQGLWQVDGITRFFNREFEGGYNPWYLFHVFDSYFNIWNYVLYGGLIYLAVQWARKRKIPEFKGDRLLIISSFLTIGLAIILMLSYNKHRWYFAPGYLFLSVITASFADLLLRKKKWLMYIFIALVWALFVRRTVELTKNDTHVADFFRSHTEIITSADELWVTGEVRQHYVLPFIMINPGKVKKAREADLQKPPKNVLLLTSVDVNGTQAGQINGYKLIIPE